MIEIYSKDNCSYCILLKKLFAHHHLEYTEMSLTDGAHTKDEIQERVGDLKKINTVPQVFIRGEYLGGYLETLEFIAYDKHIDLMLGN